MSTTEDDVASNDGKRRKSTGVVSQIFNLSIASGAAIAIPRPEGTPSSLPTSARLLFQRRQQLPDQVSRSAPDFVTASIRGSGKGAAASRSDSFAMERKDNEDVETSTDTGIGTADKTTPDETKIDITEPPKIMETIEISEPQTISESRSSSRNGDIVSKKEESIKVADEVKDVVSPIKISLHKAEKVKKQPEGANFWEKVAGVGNRVNRVDVAAAAARQRRRSSDTPGHRDVKTAKSIRKMRKKVSVASQGQNKTSQEDLALAVVEGNLVKVENIVDAYVALYGGAGFKTLLGYRYNMDPRTLIISCNKVNKEAKPSEQNKKEKRNSDVSVSNDSSSSESSDDDEDVVVGGSALGETTATKNATVVTTANRGTDIFEGLSVVHIACAFDQEQIVAYFVRYGVTVLKAVSSSGQSLLHTCAWFGTSGPMRMLVKNGCDVYATNARRQHALHLAALRGHLATVQCLVHAGADLDAGDEGGNTPLHAAVLAGNYDCVQELVNFDADVNKPNMDNGTPLHYAMTTPIVSLLIGAGADPTVEIREDDQAVGEGKTAFNRFLETMPESCNEILSSYLHSNGKSLGAVDLELRYNYDLFAREAARNPEAGEIGVLTNICDADQRDILKHPVCESFLHMKWLLIKNNFSLYLAFYVLFVASLTFYVLLEFSSAVFGSVEDPETRSHMRLVGLVLVLATVAVLALKNVFLFFYSPKHYMGNLQNFIELVMMAASALCVGMHYFSEGDVAPIVVHLAAISLFLAWFNFTLLLGKLPSSGIYINMIVGISKDVLRFMLLYTSTLVAFGLAFHVVAQHKEHFEDPLSSILCMLAMMVGEFNFGDLFVNSEIKYHWTTQILFVAFLLLVSIIIMNLLVGLAISNITGQFMLAGVYRLKMTVNVIRMIEAIISVARKILPCCFRHSVLLDHLTYAAKAAGGVGERTVYVYPNQPSHRSAVYVRDRKTGVLRRTGLVLPKWIIENTFKLLGKENDGSVTSLQAAIDRRRQEDKLYKLGTEIKNIKREFQNLKHDLQTVASFVKAKRT